MTNSALRRSVAAAALGPFIGAAASLAALATGAAVPAQFEANLNPVIFVAVAIAGATVAGLSSVALIPRWPATAVVAVTLITIVTAVAVFVAWLWVRMFAFGTPPFGALPEGQEGDVLFWRALFSLVIPPVAAIIFPISFPETFLFVVAGAVAWVIAARLVLTGSFRVRRTRVEIGRDLLLAFALAFFVWGPVSYLSSLAG
jgi:hypothetical protein